MSTSPDMEQIKAAMRATWMAGDFGVIARPAVAGAEEFIAALDLPADARVLDIACGTGNTTLPLARRGFRITGLDIAPNLLEQARTRAVDEGLHITFLEGDAEALPFQDGEFDAIVTMFGAMFAPRPDVVVSECARVLRQGGTLAMANWTPGGFTGSMFRLGAKHAPPPPGISAPVLWGEATVVKQRLEAYFENIRSVVTPLVFDIPRPPEYVVAQFREYFGPTKMAFSRLDAEGRQALENDLVALWSGANRSPEPTARTLVHNEYLTVIATRK